MNSPTEKKYVLHFGIRNEDQSVTDTVMTIDQQKFDDFEKAAHEDPQKVLEQIANYTSPDNLKNIPGTFLRVTAAIQEPAESDPNLTFEKGWNIVKNKDASPRLYLQEAVLKDELYQSRKVYYTPSGDLSYKETYNDKGQAEFDMKYSPTGQKTSERVLKNGVPILQINYDKSGRKSNDVTMINGQPTLITLYSESGLVQSQITGKDMKKIRQVNYISGVKRADVLFENEQVIFITKYDQDGLKYHEAAFKNGRISHSSTYYKTGGKELENDYVNGQKISGAGYYESGVLKFKAALKDTYTTVFLVSFNEDGTPDYMHPHSHFIINGQKVSGGTFKKLMNITDKKFDAFIEKFGQSDTDKEVIQSLRDLRKEYPYNNQSSSSSVDVLKSIGGIILMAIGLNGAAKALQPTTADNLNFGAKTEKVVELNSAKISFHAPQPVMKNAAPFVVQDNSKDMTA